MPNHNRFSQDTLNERAYRLERIEENLADYATELSLPTELSTWGATCSTNYSAARSKYLLESSESQEATMILLEKIDFMESEYQIAKNFAFSLYDGEPERLLGLKFDEAFPVAQRNKIERVFHVVKKHARLVAEGVTPILPSALLTRLETAATDAQNAMISRNKESDESEDASEEFKILWANDTKKLAKLFSWCQMIWGTDGENLNNLAFARSSELGHGGGGHPPAAPSGLHLEGETLGWTAVDGATSYGVSLSSDGGTHWESDFTSSSNSTVVPVIEIGKLYYRVRARNAHGYGDYSGTYEYLFGLAAVENFENDGNNFTWSPVQYANGYDIQRTPAGEESWVLIYNSGGLSTSDSPGSGNWMYRIRASYGTVKGEWTELEVGFV
jgi:hypothetical protein